MTDLLLKYDINPYDFLEITEEADIKAIKLAYKKKAKILHPDKSGGKTEMKFKLLNLCYKFARDNCLDTNVSTHNELKEQQKETPTFKGGYTIDDFANMEKRRAIIQTEDIDFETFEKKLSAMNTQSVNYNAIDYYKSDLLAKMKTKGKFCDLKFNAYFQKIKEQGKVNTTQIEKVTRIKAYNEDNKYQMVNSYNGMIINTTEPGGNYKETTSSTLSKRDICDLINTTGKMEMDIIIKNNQKNTEAMAPKEIKMLKKKMEMKILVNTKKSYRESETDLERENIKRIKKEMEKQKKIVEENKHLYHLSIEPPKFL